MRTALRWLTYGTLLAAVLGWLSWYLAYGQEAVLPTQAVLPELGTATTLTLQENGGVHIEATSQADALTALGYAHGLNRTWSLLLWRKAALGELATWYGEDMLPLDGLARKLGLGALAETTFVHLAATEQATLAAYAAGVNAAFAEEWAHRRDELVLLGVEPTPWAPWHTLALERLFAWLGTTPPPAAERGRLPGEVQAFYETDRRLRQWLQLYGFEHSTAWAVPDSAGMLFFQRHVYGSTALPFFLDARISLGEGRVVEGATVPGTPFFPAGRTATRAWAVRLVSGAEAQPFQVDSTRQFRMHQERLVDAQQQEYPLVYQTLDADLLLAAPRDTFRVDTFYVRRVRIDTTRNDTIRYREQRFDTVTISQGLVLDWPGLQAGTDLAAWMTLWEDRRPAFSLLRGEGLRVSANGQWQVWGTPPAQVRVGPGVVIGEARWTPHLASRLDTLRLLGSEADTTWVADTYSRWAATFAPPLVAAMDTLGPHADIVGEALVFLRNWDHQYDRSSIAASIFDNWIRSYRDSTGTWPDPNVPDTLRDEQLFRYEVLRRTIAKLAEDHGGDLERWRWEYVEPDVRRFPGWVDTLSTARRYRQTARTRYAPLSFASAGHPSAVRWHATPLQEGMPAPAAWEGWLHVQTGEGWQVRRRNIDTRQWLGRHLLDLDPPSPTALAAPPDHTIILRPGAAITR